MPAFRTRLALLPFLLLPSGLRADAEIPAVGRPADLPFSEASGDFRVRAAAAPTTMEAETPFTLTLTVEAVAPVRQPPRRIDLRELPAFKDRFDFLEGGKDDDRRPSPQVWEFAYRLQPKRGDVKAVPGVPFVFFNPDIQYPRKGFQVAYTDAIPLTVAPHEAYVVPVPGPPFLFTLAVGDPILRRWAAWTPPGLLTAVLLLAAPLLCLAWFFGRRRLYPDAARVARQRRSLAARRALAALRGAKRLPPVQQAARSAAVVADYLRARFDAPAEEPTPVEAADCLSRAGRSPALAERAAGFFRACDAVRFAPDGPAVRADLTGEAAAFILAVEAETWPPSHS